jgi:hypothetical protein
MIARETLYEALLNEVRKVNGPTYDLGVPVISRDFTHWADAAIQPAIYVVQENEIAQAVRGLPTKWTRSATLWIYAKKDGDTLAIQLLNPIVDAIEDMLAPVRMDGVTRNFPPGVNVNTLGGLVERVSINGNIEWSGGYLGDQAVAAVPLEIITA